MIAFGKVRIIEDEKEVRESIEKLAIKYHPKDSEENRNREIYRAWDSFSMIEFSIEHMTGKKAREL